jgi:hypothetical protein
VSSEKRNFAVDEKNGKNPFLALTIATVLFATLGVIVYTQAPFQGTRPSVPEIQEPSAKIRARLWQDPFQAVLDHAKSGEVTNQGDRSKSQPAETQGGKKKLIVQKNKNPKDVSASCLSLAKAQALEGKLKEEIKQKGDVTVLGVMVLGGPYGDDTELRLRMRYAVLAALDVLNYKPEDAEHIDFLQLCPSTPEDQQAKNIVSLSTIVPFEWLVSDDQQKSVLLLWLNDDMFREAPLTKLENLQGNLQAPFKIIGPATSTTLLEMAKENKELDLEIYSATATAAAAILEKEALKKPGLTLEPGKFWRRLDRTILSDRQLAEGLVDELRRRGVDLIHPDPKQRNHVVLVAEWDTFYGRALPQSFKDVIRDRLGLGPQAEIPWIHRFSYLRGMDGKLPGDNSGAAAPKKDGGGSKDSRDLRSLEEPMGRSQYDYLRRLAEEIYRVNSQLEQEGQGSIKAVGVLGNDFYDKYLVLQALRQRFPEKIFFTTDLDARYLHPANIEWTRNLVVASTFGLQLREDLQGEVPPFRDVYSTSVFAATLRAFSRLHKNDFENLKPRIFEIGRRNAIDLTVEKQQNPGQAPINRALPAQTFLDIDWLWFLAVTVVLSILALLFWSLWLRDPRDTNLSNSLGQFIKKAYPFWLALLVIGLLIAWFHWQILLDPAEEPFSLTEGVSVWPTEIIRLLALVLSWIFFVRCRNWLINNETQIALEFSMGDKPANEPEGAKTVNSEWAQYLRRSFSPKRYLMIGIIVVFYLVLNSFIVGLFGLPTPPVRGDLSLKIDTVILILTVISFLFLTFFVLDAIMLCQRFIARYFQRLPQWQPSSFDRFLQEWVKESDRSMWMESKAKEALSDWMLMQLIARRTEVVGTFIFFPFIIWFLMFVARLRYFDNWQTSMGLAIVISMSAVLAWGCAVYLRHAAEKLRTLVAQRLAKQLMEAYATEPPNKTAADRIQYVLNEVKAIKTGAFASYLQQPALQSLLVPVGGISGVKVLEFLASLS